MSNVATRIKRMTVEEGQCRLWTGYMVNGSPLINVNGAGTSVRRLVWREKHGPIAPNLLAHAQCGNPACVAAEHIVLMTAQEIAKKAAAAGAFSTPQRRAAQSAAARRHAKKLNLELAREIRLSSDTSKVVAARYGISPSLVKKVRAGKAWADGVLGSSVFAWRPE